MGRRGMASRLLGTGLLLLALQYFVLSVQGDFVEPPPSFSLRSISEERTRLPCKFQVEDGQVVQVSWVRERPGGVKEQLITAHHTQGQPVFGKFSERLHFENNNPMADSALIIQNTEVSDEAVYTCLISTFPSGNFERKLSLTVWNPPNPTVKGYDHNWVVGYEGASLRCESGGNPKPENFTWSRRGGALPDDVTAEGGTLRFGRPLAVSDAGVYECEARNSVGAMKAEAEILLQGTARQASTLEGMMPILGGAIGALVLILVVSMVTVTCYHKRKSRKLEKELSEKLEEYSTLSRQASIRRFSSINTECRTPMEEHIPLPSENHVRNSTSSLLGPPGKRDSHSTLSMGRAERPVLYTSFRRAERDAYVPNGINGQIVSSGSQNPSPLTVSPAPVSLSSVPPPVKMAYSSAWSGAPTPPDDEAEENEEEDGSSVQISDAVSRYFHYNNKGVLAPKSQPKVILLQPRGQLI
ncbi:nectin-4-like isoform X2 [Conger conger]|uniref:nectin-4-like isoform X2 n=1 Tax=Conger conger TaxID=82655 RepID=UPI002A5AB57B|nr:nectin-4-like isoform X2 [Conger conger]